MSGQHLHLMNASDRAGERNDCAVRAVAAITHAPYESVLDLFERCGRKPQRGTPNYITCKVLDLMGYTWADITFLTKEKARTTVTASRWLSQNAWGKTVLLQEREHIAAWNGKEIVDTYWRQQSKHRVYQLILVHHKNRVL